MNIIVNTDGAFNGTEVCEREREREREKERERERERERNNNNKTCTYLETGDAIFRYFDRALTHGAQEVIKVCGPFHEVGDAVGAQSVMAGQEARRGEGVVAHRTRQVHPAVLAGHR